MKNLMKTSHFHLPQQPSLSNNKLTFWPFDNFSFIKHSSEYLPTCSTFLPSRKSYRNNIGSKDELAELDEAERHRPVFCSENIRPILFRPSGVFMNLIYKLHVVI